LAHFSFKGGQSSKTASKLINLLWNSNVLADKYVFPLSLRTLKVIQLRESRSKNAALQYFEAVLKTNSRNIEALFGKAKYYELCGHFDEANKEQSTLVVVYPKFTPPLVEKMKV
jgi:tetratricopeptide (TPR) repeat protein